MPEILFYSSMFILPLKFVLQAQVLLLFQTLKLLQLLYFATCFSLCVRDNKTTLNVADVVRWRQLETRTWLSVDCLSLTLVDTLLRSAVWLPIWAS